MSNEYYNHGSWPAAGSSGASASARAEMDAITAGFALLPTMSGNANKAVVVGAGATSLTTTTGTLALAGNLATTGAFNTTLAAQVTGTFTLPPVGGLTIATLTGTETLTNKTLTAPTMTAPVLGTPASGTLTLCTGLPLTTGVTGTLGVTNGGTGVTTSTGSGANALATSPTLVTPILGTPTSGTLTNCTGLVLTSGVTGTLPVANGGTGVTSSTGSGANALATSPTLVTPVLGTPSSGTLTSCTGLPISTGVSGLGTGVATFLATPSSANLAAALTDETGSGAAVFATSPTLVTPILGTPTSGTLTNATGLPISTGVSGLGTGVATALAVNTGSAGAVITRGGDAGTPSAIVLTNATGTAASLTAGNATAAVTVSTTVASGATGTTQAAYDNTTKMATTAYVDRAATHSYANVTGGSTPVYGANFGFTGSITRNGTGDYTLSFATAMGSANYAVLLTGDNSGARANTLGYVVSKATGTIRVAFIDDTSTAKDPSDWNILVHGS